MPSVISDSELDALLRGDAPFALIDVRESGEYNSSHIPGACLIPRRRIEFIIEDSVPAKNVPVVVCDDDGRRAPLAAATLERLGYTNVSVLDGGVNRWSARDYPTEWGVERAQQGLRREAGGGSPRSGDFCGGPARTHRARRQAGHPRHPHPRGVPAVLHPRRPQYARRRAGAAHHRRHQRD